MNWWELGLVSRHIGHEFSLKHLVCPNCSARENFVRLFRIEKRGAETKQDHTADIWQCRHCSEALFVQWHTEKGMVSYRIYPQNMRQGFEDVLPNDINEEYQQAISAYISESWDIATVLAKRIIDLVAQEFNVEGKGLLDIISQLVNKGILTKNIQDWATQIETLAPEISSQKLADQQTARELLTFVRWVLDLVYLLPHTIKRYR